MKKYTGRKYKPIDNSWSCNLSISLGNDYKTDPLQKDYLAGTVNTPSKIATILTEPFKLNIISMEYDGIRHREHDFVIIEVDNQQHIQLFKERGVLELTDSI